MLTRAAVCLLWFSLLLHAVEAPEGIPREWAMARAAVISDLHYRLNFTLVPHSDAAPGKEEISFKLSLAFPLWLDFRGADPRNLSVNGAAVPVETSNGHVLLPANALRVGENRVALEFTAPVGPAGKAITRYEDKDDGGEYFYTLFVPMDASQAFPCFDQPDLKGRFRLTVDFKGKGVVIANTKGEETEPISTYLFAFAAGPFETLHHSANLPDVYVRHSQLKRAEPEIPAVEQITAEGIRFFAGYFAQPFPFPKYDMVLLPGFPFAGMEHAGATFLNEDSVLFRSAPTDDDRFNRQTLLLHELAHQWFGDLTTMRWFDDLWLKEGFAQFMAYRALSTLRPDQNVWTHFYQQIKPAAYNIDVTKGTTPIYQSIENLKDAKSAYGAIVYSKAPGLLKQLSYLLGDDHFRDGLRIYLREHRYANAQWSDLVSAFERASSENLKGWAHDWITRRGLPEVRTDWQCDNGKLTHFELIQRDALGEGRTWPLETEVLLGYENALPVKFRTRLPNKDLACPAFVFANDSDNSYGLFLLDAKSRTYILRHVGALDLFPRTLLWGALWDSVRAAELSPADYVTAALRELPNETNETLVRTIGARTIEAMHDYGAGSFTEPFETLSLDKAFHARAKGLRILWFRSLLAAAYSPQALDAIKGLLSGSSSIPEVELRPLDRWRMIAVLLANRAPGADEIYQAEIKRDAKYAYVAAAAKPDAATKATYFADYLHNASRQEDWVQESLGDFNYWNQSTLTLPYLRPALEALPRIKRERKIFFTLAWLNSFIGGQHSNEAAEIVRQWLATTSIDDDLKLKVLQVDDNLERAAKIQQKFR